MRDAAFSLLHDLGLPAILSNWRKNNKEITILMFHRITDEHDPLWPSMPVASFRNLMKEVSLKTHVVPLQEIKKVDRYPDKPLVALSFDDGYMDFFDNALPILKEFNLPAHHTVCPDLIDSGMPPWTQILNKSLKMKKNSTQKDFINICKEMNSMEDSQRKRCIDSLYSGLPKGEITKLMGWNQIRECAKAGIYIGSHGMSHTNMGNIKDVKRLDYELRESKERIFKETGIDPVIFSFPKGSHSPLSLEAANKSGYEIALLCGDKAARLKENDGQDFYVFPRINICRVNWKEEILRMLGLHQKVKKLFFLA